MNNTTKILIHHLSANPSVAGLQYNTRDLINKLIIDHSNHLLVMALAAAAIEYVDWNAIEETLESIKNRD
jgi:hypothetical protein